MPLRRALPLLLALAVLAFPPGPASAGGYLKLSPGGVIYRWDNSSMLPRDLDGGPLGTLSEAEAQALVEDASSGWASPPTLERDVVTTSTGTLTGQGGDGDVDTFSEFQTLVGQLVAGSTTIQNAIVFDHDGAVIEAHFGVGSGSGILGFALILGADDSSFHLTHTVQVYNGECVENPSCGEDEISEEELIETIVHEQGHVLNLDHVQVNGHWFFGDTNDPGFQEYGDPPQGDGAVNLMFPFVLASSEYAAEIGHDELTAAEHLYGNDTSSATGVISGTVYRSDGVTPLQGVNLIARNTADPFYDATSSVSGYRFPTSPLTGGTPQDEQPACPSTTPPELHGDYDLRGLTPGQSYTVEAVAVNAGFICGSSVGPLQRPVGFPQEEFYSTPESSKDSISPENLTTILVPPPPSPVVSGIDLVQSCRSGNRTVSAGTIGGEAYFDACDTLTVASGVVISGSGNAVFAADRVVLSSGFRVASGGRLVVRPLSQ